MSDSERAGVHWSFWAVAVIALIWNALGVVNYFAQMNPEVLAQYRETERALVEGRPAWATAGFALAVFGGAIGALLLLFRKKAAIYGFIVSLVGTIVAVGHSLTVDIEFGTGEIVGIIGMPVALAAFLIWYARTADGKGWLG